MITLSEKQLESLDENIDTNDILGCVDVIDEMRGVFRDHEINTPPQIRDDLLKLHTVLFEGIQRFGGNFDDELPDLLANTIDELETLKDNAEDVLKVLRKIEKHLPEDIYG